MMLGFPSGVDDRLVKVSFAKLAASLQVPNDQAWYATGLSLALTKLRADSTIMLLLSATCQVTRPGSNTNLRTRIKRDGTEIGRDGLGLTPSGGFGADGYNFNGAITYRQTGLGVWFDRPAGKATYTVDMLGVSNSGGTVDIYRNAGLYAFEVLP